MTSALPDSTLSLVQPKKNLDTYVVMQYTSTITEAPKQKSAVLPIYSARVWRFHPLKGLSSLIGYFFYFRVSTAAIPALTLELLRHAIRCSCSWPIMTSALPDSTLSLVQPKKNLDTYVVMQYTSTITEAPKQKSFFDIKLWGWSFLSIVPWAVGSRGNIQTPTTINRGLKRKAQRRRLDASNNMSPPVRFRPYVGKVPWHTGPRAVLSQLFPRYGHYCGPNWSSGKDGGSLIWDKRPIDWLDYCCYCHDMGYDTHDQAKLLKADLAFLDCLEKPHITKGNKQVAHIYRTMCLQGLRNFLIPYRRHLLRMQSVQEWMTFGWVNNLRWRGWNILSNLKREG